MENSTHKMITCSHCKKEMSASAAICNHCGYPENGTQQEKSAFIGTVGFNETWNREAKQKIKSARNTLFVLSGVIAVFGYIQYSEHQDLTSLAINFGISFIYLALAFWTETKPWTAVLTGLLLYISVVLINAIMDPTTLFRGIIWKVVIIAFLGKGLHWASTIKKNDFKA